MSFNDAMNRMLPKQGSITPHITAPYGELRPSGPHGGVDFNYMGGQSGINLQHPTIHAPIAGQITFSGGQYGTIKIRDAEGNSHEILHTHSQSVHAGQQVTEGHVVGTMGGRGPGGQSAYAQHVHYQIRNPQGIRINPQEWWDQRGSATQETTAQADTRLKPLRFAFPFRSADGKEITDEHEFHALLKKEASGNYCVSAKGMWHGGIHISEGGAGAALDLKYGVRCIADGEVVAFRANKAYLVSPMPAQDDKPAREAKYSTGFALVRHVMEFPKGTKLTFFSLYMHLQDLAGYESDKTLPWPAYWQPDFTVTQFANDKPTGGPAGTTPAGQVGLRVRATHPHGTPLCILPRGTQVSISKREGDWGQIKDTQGAQLLPPTAGGYVAPAAAIGGWMFLGKEGGHPMVDAVIPDSMLDRVVTLDKPVKIKAGDLIGHLGRYDSLSQPSENRMVHIEVFCGDGIKSFVQQGRTWIDDHGHHPQDWVPLGLSSEPAILRIAKNTKLFKQAMAEGQDAPVTDVIQVIALAELAKKPKDKVVETTADGAGKKKAWYHVRSADVRGADIDGWVRQENFAGGRTTLEFAQSWIDFDASFEDPHDQTHTMFATTKVYVDYATGADVPAPAAMDKLSPLMAKVYRTIYTKGDGSQAADELCQVTDDPWRALRVSRLIIKHESEWANPGKWQQLIQEIEKQTGPQPQHEEEQKRIETLVWWNDVTGGVTDLPGSDVFHIHPIGLLGNFFCESQLITLAMLVAAEPDNTDAYNSSILPHLNKYAKIYEVNTPKRIAHFLSQAAHESGFRIREENLNYSARQMRKTFGCKGGPDKYNFACDDCTNGRLRDKLWSQEANYAHNAENLGSYVYANRMENGDEPSKEGFKYRGRGIIQVTGKSGYRSFQNEHNLRCPDDHRNFVEDPDLVSTNLGYGIESGFVFWARNNLNSVADTGDVHGVTQIVNGGQHGYTDRRTRYNRVALVLGIPAD